MGRNKRKQWDESAWLNNRTYAYYRRRMLELKLSMYEWKNLPDTVDQRYLELALFFDGKAIFFKDEVMGYLALKCSANGPFNVYNIPIRRRAYASNGYNNADLDETNSVIIYNNYTRSNSVEDVDLYARRLYNFDRIIDVNTNAQKTPILIQCSKDLELTMKNLYEQYDGNIPAIFANNNLDLKNVTVLQTGAPYVADKIYAIKNQYWNEVMTQMGISNVTFEKKERMFTREVSAQQGSIIANRFSPLEMRQKACEEINKMFNLDIWCDYRSEMMEEADETIGKSTANPDGWHNPEEGDANE